MAPRHPTPPPTIDAFEHRRYLNCGHFGSVHLYENPTSGDKMAVKACCSGTGIEDPLHEVRALERIRLQPHPNVITFLGHQQVLDGSIIALEYIGGGELFDHVIEVRGSPNSPPSMPPRRRRRPRLVSPLPPTSPPTPPPTAPPSSSPRVASCRASERACCYET